MTASQKDAPRSMPDTQIDFSAAATLKKWPSVNKERVSATLGARPYTIIAGTLDECIRKFMSLPVSQHHLYEIHTALEWAPRAGQVQAADLTVCRVC
jgi:hypothetical protein